MADTCSTCSLNSKMVFPISAYALPPIGGSPGKNNAITFREAIQKFGKIHRGWRTLFIFERGFRWGIKWKSSMMSDNFTLLNEFLNSVYYSRVLWTGTLQRHCTGLSTTANWDGVLIKWNLASKSHPPMPLTRRRQYPEFHQGTFLIILGPCTRPCSSSLNGNHAFMLRNTKKMRFGRPRRLRKLSNSSIMNEHLSPQGLGM